MLSTPAFVRVSASITSPSFRHSATQYVIARLLPFPSLLLLGRHHSYRDAERFLCDAAANATDRCRRPVIKPDGRADIRFVWPRAVRRVETDPAVTRDIGFRPGMTGLDRRGFAGPEIPAHIARRNAAGAARSNEQVRMILADAGADAQGFGGGGHRRGDAGAVIDARTHGFHKGHQAVDRRRAVDLGPECRDFGCDRRQRRRAQIELRW